MQVLCTKRVCAGLYVFVIPWALIDMQSLCRLLCSCYAGCYAVVMQQKGGSPMHACITNPPPGRRRSAGSSWRQPKGLASLIINIQEPQAERYAKHRLCRCQLGEKDASPFRPRRLCPRGRAETGQIRSRSAVSARRRVDTLIVEQFRAGNGFWPRSRTCYGRAWKCRTMPNWALLSASA